MMNGEPGAFRFATAGRIEFGAGKVAEVAPVARELGRRALVVTGCSGERAERLRELLTSAGVELVRHVVAGEPKVSDIEEGVAAARDGKCELVIGLGGGSAMDAAKAVAALLTNSGGALEYLEVIGEGRPLEQTPAPVIAIPTTSGTGAEVTRNAVLASPEHKVKVSLRHPLMLPRLAIVDPELTVNLPSDLTATTGLDALTQLIEPFTCTRANPLTDALCREAIPRAARSLRAACEDPEPTHRTDMALASLLGGLALSNSGLGAVHGFAAPIGGMFPAAHGAVCAALLPHVMATNLAALRARAPDSEVLARYDEVAGMVCRNPRAEEGETWVRNLVGTLGILGLGAYGITEEDFPIIIEKARRASSMKANPIELTEEELVGILRAAL